jgi:hypothetical protein
MASRETLLKIVHKVAKFQRLILKLKNNVIMKTKNPLVFPVIGVKNKIDNYGITLRDYFAALAMQSMLSNSNMYDDIKYGFSKNLSKDSYDIADEMLKIREETES